MAPPPLPPVPGVDVRHRDVALPDGTRLHVAEAGHGEPLVLLHGWPQHWWMWRRVLPALARGRRVICPDLRGFGWSDAPPGAYAKEDLATDVLALLDALGIQRLDLAGHDWGGFVAFLVSLRAPARIRRLAVLSIIHPWFRPPRPTPKALKRLSYQYVLATPVIGTQALRRSHAFVNTMLRRGSHPDTRWSGEELAAYARPFREPGHARASSALYRTFLTREVPALAAGRYDGLRLAAPTLLLLGTADPVVRARRLTDIHDHADDARVEIIPGAGHFPAEERPDAVVRAFWAHFTITERDDTFGTTPVEVPPRSGES
jgi:pimeloyl-ACP methyl ester carboxylesterase